MRLSGSLVRAVCSGRAYRSFSLRGALYVVGDVAIGAQEIREKRPACVKVDFRARDIIRQLLDKADVMGSARLLISFIGTITSLGGAMGNVHSILYSKVLYRAIRRLNIRNINSAKRDSGKYFGSFVFWPFNHSKCYC